MKHLEQLMLTVGLVDKVTQPIQGINQQIKQTGELGRQSMDRIVGGVAGLVASGAALYQALMPAIEMDRALAEVKSLSVVQGDLDLLGQTAIDFSIKFGKSATEFIGAAYDIKSAMGDLTGDELAGITESSAVLAAATKADTGTITKYMGSMYSIFKDQAESMGKDNFAAMIAGQTAQAVETFKTSGPEMAAAFESLGSSAAAMGVNVSEQLGVLGTLQGAMGGARAGTQYTAFIDGAIGAQKKLGMSFMDSQGKLLPMVKILGKLQDRVGDMNKDAQYKVLKDAFGSSQAVKLIQNLLPDIDGLAASINNVGKQTGMDKATEMASSMTDQWDRLGAVWFALRAGAGASILPTIHELVGSIVDAMAVLVEWTHMFPHLTEVVTWVIVGLAGLTAVAASWSIIMGIAGSMSLFFGSSMSAIIWVMKLLRLNFILIKTAQIAWLAIQGIAAAGTFILTGAFSALGVAMAFVFSPFFLIIAALALLAVGAVWLARNWDMVKATLMEMPFVQVLIGAFNGIAAGWKSFMDMLGNLNPIDMLGSAIDWLIEKLNMIPGINIKTSGKLDVPAVNQDINRSYGGAKLEKSSFATSLAPGQGALPLETAAAAKLPAMPPVTQEVSRAYAGGVNTEIPAATQNVNRTYSGAAPAQPNTINQQLSKARTPDSIKSPAAPLMPQMAAVASQNAGKTVQFGDVHIKNEQGMDPAALAEWEELQHGF